MKRKEIIETIANVGTKTFFTCGSMTLINKHDGTEVDVDMHSTFAVVRGTLAWVDSLLEDGAEPEENTAKNLQNLLHCVGSSIVFTLQDDDED